ncbi:MAG: hypothetical protein K0R17_3619 [Rariglobus sp.]|jgi:hypothetical protein|nr:hypothetical protein [Rariglobus sp.]
MNTTTELGFKIPTPPAFSPEHVERLVKILEADGGWLTASDIGGRAGPGMTERAIRAAASAACPQVISYPGSPGYKLMKFCTPDEIHHCVSAIQSQGTEMIKRANVINCAYHRWARNSSARR